MKIDKTLAVAAAAWLAASAHAADPLPAGTLITGQISGASTLLLGKGTYQDFAQYWPTVPANPNAAATSLVDADLRNDPNVYLTPEVSKRLFVTTTKGQDLLRDVNRQWTRVLTGR